MAFSIPRMQQRFERQFEAADEGGYLYRKNSKAAAIPVTSKERDTFAWQYAIRLYLIISAMVLAVTVLFGVLVLRTEMRGTGDFPPVQIFAGMVVISLIATALMEWVFRAPARALKGRAPVSPARNTEEMRAVRYNRLSYGHFGLIALLGALGPFAHSRNSWHLAWWPIAVLLVGVAATFAYRKWRFESQHPDA